MKSKIHIIAEAGTNHNGSEDLAKRLISIASKAKADSVKFQIINPWGLYLPGNYAYGHYDIKKVIEIREKGVLSDETYVELSKFASEQGIQFSASVFDNNGLDLLCSMDPPYIKIASCDLNNIRFLRRVAERGKKIILSTGMSTLKDIEKSVSEIFKVGNKDLVLLHCVSVYPAHLNQANVGFIETLKTEFDLEVGYSDHTGTSVAAAMALVKGATWFEKHFTYNKTAEGFDHAYAMEEEGFIQYVEDLRAAELSLSVAKQKISDAERYTRKRARRSIYASRDLEKGHRITDEDVLVVRPEAILDADQIDAVVGETLVKSIKQHEPFSLEHILR